MLEQIDTELFCWINHHHCQLSDWVLWVASQSFSWAIVLVLAFSLSTLRHEPRKWWLVLLGIGLCFLLSDQFSVFLKGLFCRLRPCYALENVRMFKTSCGGRYGFPSSHAANVFSLAIFLALRHKHSLPHNRAKYSQRGLFPILIFMWAIIVGYSRPYLGKHFPGDVICGALIGLFLGTLVFFITQLIDNIAANHLRQKKNS